jgi:hypothetical protein
MNRWMSWAAQRHTCQTVQICNWSTNHPTLPLKTLQSATGFTFWGGPRRRQLLEVLLQPWCWPLSLPPTDKQVICSRADRTSKRRAQKYLPDLCPLPTAKSKTLDLFLKANYLCQDSKDCYSSLRSLLVVKTKQVPGQISGTLMPSFLGWWNILCSATTSLWYADKWKAPSFFPASSYSLFNWPLTLYGCLTQIVFQINEDESSPLSSDDKGKGCSWSGSQLWHLPGGHQAECQVSNNHLPYRTYNNLPWLLTIITVLGYLYV